MYSRPRWLITKELVDAALGRVKADTVLINGILVNVYSGELLDGCNIAIKYGRIVHIGKRIDHLLGDSTQVIDLRGKYIVPGFIDAHVHIESSMLLPIEFAKAVLPHGTTTVFADPHEIANVLGVNGIRFMIENGKELPLKIFYTIPSCVPASTPEFETSGSLIEVDDVKEILKWDYIAGLGEMMNYPGVLNNDDKVHGEISATLEAGLPVEGHYADPYLDEKLSAYIAAGISSCHESTRKIDGLERVRRGIWVMIREGSAWHDLKEVIKAVTETRIDKRRFILVTDDRHPEDIIHEGHIDHVVRRAIEEGVDPVSAIQMVTLNPAEHYRLDLEIGGIAPGRYADINILNDLSKVDIYMVIANGEIVAKDGKLSVGLPTREVPSYVLDTVKTAKKRYTPEDFTIKAPVKEGIVKAHVIKVYEAKVTTKHLILDIQVSNYEIKPDIGRDIAKVAVIERHHRTGNMGIGLVTGFGFKSGAIASTVAHDSHNLLVAGVDESDMAIAVNKLIEVGGGMIVVENGRILGLVELRVAGLMSTEDVYKVSEKVSNLNEAWRKISSLKTSPFMTMSLLSLSVLPELRVTDKGLIDTLRFKKIDLIEVSKN